MYKNTVQNWQSFKATIARWHLIFHCMLRNSWSILDLFDSPAPCRTSPRSERQDGWQLDCHPAQELALSHHHLLWPELSCHHLTLSHQPGHHLVPPPKRASPLVPLPVPSPSCPGFHDSSIALPLYVRMASPASWPCYIHHVKPHPVYRLSSRPASQEPFNN